MADQVQLKREPDRLHKSFLLTKHQDTLMEITNMPDQFNLEEFQAAVLSDVDRLVQWDRYNKLSRRRGVAFLKNIHALGRINPIRRTGLTKDQLQSLLEVLEGQRNIDDPELIELHALLKEDLSAITQIELMLEMARQRKQMEQQQLFLEELLALGPQDELSNDKAQTPAQTSTSGIDDLRDDRDQLSQAKRDDRDQLSRVKSEELVKRPDIRALLCPALQTASDDAFEIAKIATPILVGLVLAGTLTIPLIPTLFASIALTISRLGIASLCADLNESKD